MFCALFADYSQRFQRLSCRKSWACGALDSETQQKEIKNGMSDMWYFSIVRWI
jgi:hypothetical protein